MVLIGGHYKEISSDLKSNHTWDFKMSNPGIYCFDSIGDHWFILKIKGNKDKLQRSCYSASCLGSKIVMSGGNFYQQSRKIDKLSILDVSVVDIEMRTQVATIITHSIEMNFPYGWCPKMSGASMMHFDKKLLVFGGSNSNKRPGLINRNGKLVIIDLLKEKGTLQEPPLALSKKVLVFGGSAHSIGNHSAIFLGGSLPIAGKCRFL
jgi:hypothetical protein